MKTFLIILVLLVVAGSAGVAIWYYYKNKKPAGQTTTSTTLEQASEDIDAIIKKSALGMAVPEITDVVITDKKFYTDSQGTQWVRFLVTPIPEGFTDPATGIMKKVVGGQWQTVSFGTSLVEEGLPADVKKGLGF